MSDQVIGRLEPLTGGEKLQRIDERTVIEIKSSYLRNAIGRDWTRASAASDSPYGYVEKRVFETVEWNRLELKLPFNLDVAGLTKAILAEVARQTEVEK